MDNSLVEAIMARVSPGGPLVPGAGLTARLNLLLCRFIPRLAQIKKKGQTPRGLTQFS